MRQLPPIAFFTLFCLGTLAVVGYVLGTSNGLAELHKTVLVGFLVAFPSLTLLIFLSLMPKVDATEVAPFRSRNADIGTEPLGLSPASRV
jgi:hypothetical protein